MSFYNLGTCCVIGGDGLDTHIRTHRHGATTSEATRATATITLTCSRASPARSPANPARPVATTTSGSRPGRATWPSIRCVATVRPAIWLLLPRMLTISSRTRVIWRCSGSDPTGRGSAGLATPPRRPQKTVDLATPGALVQKMADFSIKNIQIRIIRLHEEGGGQNFGALFS